MDGRVEGRKTDRRMEGRKASEGRTVRRKKGIYEGRKNHKKE